MNAKLFVRNLSWSVSENDLYDLFGQAGTVVQVKIPTNRETGKPRGFAFVEMGSSDAAKSAIQQLNGTPLYDRDIVVDYQDESRQERPGGGSRGGFGGASGPQPKLFVRNIAPSVNEYDLQQFFEQAGGVVSAKIPTDRETGDPRGFGFIEMASVEEATRAVETLNGAMLDGSALQVAYQDPAKAKPPGGGGRGGYGGGGGRGGYGGGGGRSYGGGGRGGW